MDPYPKRLWREEHVVKPNNHINTDKKDARPKNWPVTFLPVM